MLCSSNLLLQGQHAIKAGERGRKKNKSSTTTCSSRLRSPSQDKREREREGGMGETERKITGFIDGGGGEELFFILAGTHHPSSGSLARSPLSRMFREKKRKDRDKRGGERERTE